MALLLGRYQEAASRYEEASFAAAGGRDNGLLLRAARARLASGDAERATDLASLVLLASTGDAELSARARLVGAWALAARGRAEEARGMAEAIAGSASTGSPAPTDLRREARFLCWVVAEAPAGHQSKSAAAALLANEFPGSVEALVASGAIAAPPMPHWYLGSLSFAGSSGAGRNPPIAVPPPSEGGGSAAPPQTGAAATAAAPETAGGKAARFQVGYYSKEENARTMNDRLRAQGFAASIEARPSVREKPGDDGRRWAVVIDGGKDPEGTQARLKDAGYESYPIF
jgi:cell division septation protein DedD